MAVKMRSVDERHCFEWWWSQKWWVVVVDRDCALVFFLHCEKRRGDHRRKWCESRLP